MTDIDIPRLMALAESATPGPWRTHMVNGTLVIAEHEEIATAFGNYETDHASMEANAAYIATADPTTILALCRMAQHQTAEIKAKAIKAAADAVFSLPMSDGDPFSVLVHFSDYIPGDIPIEDQITKTRDICRSIVETAIAAYERAMIRPLADAPDEVP